MKYSAMGLIHTAAILAIDNRCCTPSLKLKCLGMSFRGAKQVFQSLGTQRGCHVIKAHNAQLFILSELLWFCITSLSDCFKVLTPLFQPIRSEIKPKPIVACMCTFSRALCLVLRHSIETRSKSTVPEPITHFHCQITQKLTLVFCLQVG